MNRWKIKGYEPIRESSKSSSDSESEDNENQDVLSDSKDALNKDI